VGDYDGGQQGPIRMGSGTILVRDKPAQVEMVAADASSSAEGSTQMRRSLSRRIRPMLRLHPLSL
jgi:hypothetical protein